MREMRERPILFSGEMVRAIRERRKRQTRRVIVPQPMGEWSGPMPCEAWPCPYGQPGDRLWVREAFQPIYAEGFTHGDVDWKTGEGYAPRYLATDDRIEWMDGDDHLTDRAMPGIHMPRWASRILLEITGVRVERVKEISKADAIAEGIQVLPLQSADDPSAWYQSAPGVNQERTAQASYRALWDSINAKRNDGIYAWAKNPWTWVLEFEEVKP